MEVGQADRRFPTARPIKSTRPVNPIEFFDKDGTLGSETGHDPRVVHNLMSDEDRRAKPG
jgi:hypothetical protein